MKQILHFSNHWLLFQRSMLRVHQAAWRMQMYNGCPATNFLPLPSFPKSAYEIKWNRSGNCLLLFQALISRRRYRETFLQRERGRERKWREKPLPEQGGQHSSQASAWNSDKKSFQHHLRRSPHLYSRFATPPSL